MLPESEQTDVKPGARGPPPLPIRPMPRHTPNPEKAQRESQFPGRNVKTMPCPDCQDNALGGERVTPLPTQGRKYLQGLSKCARCGGSGEVPVPRGEDGRVNDPYDKTTEPKPDRYINRRGVIESAS